jgi:hypothetical protein
LERDHTDADPLNVEVAEDMEDSICWMRLLSRWHCAVGGTGAAVVAVMNSAKRRDLEKYMLMNGVGSGRYVP